MLLMEDLAINETPPSSTKSTSLGKALVPYKTKSTFREEAMPDDMDFEEPLFPRPNQIVGRQIAPLRGSSCDGDQYFQDKRDFCEDTTPSKMQSAL